MCQKHARKHITIGCYLKVTRAYRGLKRGLYFIKNKLLTFLCSLGYCVLCIVYCVFSLLGFCKPLDLSSHFVLKIVCIVCDGIVSHCLQTLDTTAFW